MYIKKIQTAGEIFHGITKRWITGMHKVFQTFTFVEWMEPKCV